MLNPDYMEFLQALQNHKVKFVVVGAYALSFYGHPRMTGDIDFWIYPDEANASNLMRALNEFGFEPLNLTAKDILSGEIIQLGVAPVSVDILTVLSGVTTHEIWSGRVRGVLGDFIVDYISKDVYIKNKTVLGRHKDLADAEAIQK